MKHQLAYRRVCLKCDAIDPSPVSECKPKPKHTIPVSEHDWQKLVGFAEYRGVTPQQVVAGWISVCQIKPYSWKPFGNLNER